MIPPAIDRLRRLPRAFWACLAAAFAICGLFSARLSPLVQDPAIPDAYAIALAAPDATTTSALVLYGPWDHEPGAGATPKAPDAYAELRLPPGLYDRFSIRLWSPEPDARWVVSLQSGFARTVLPNVLTGKALALPIDLSHGAGGEEWRVQVRPVSVAVGTARLNIVEVKLQRWNRGLEGLLPGVVGIALSPGLLAALLWLSAGWKPTRAAAFGIGIGGLGAILLWWQPQFVSGGFAAGLMLALAVAVQFLRDRWLRRTHPEDSARTRRRLTECGAVLAILLIALHLRAERWLEVRGSELRPDAQGYVEIARERSFYDSETSIAPWVREPLFPGVLRVGWWFLPDTENAARATALALSLIAILLLYLLGRRLFGVPVGLLASGLLATNGEFARLAVEVLRTDLVLCLFLGLALAVVTLGEARAARAPLLGVLAGALVLTQINNLLFALVAGAWEAIRRRWHWREIAFAAIVVLAMLVPHLRFNMRMHGSGDPFYSSTVHTRFFANREFAGKPGYPTPAEVAANPYSGPPMSGLQYVKEIGFANLPLRIARGYLHIFVHPMPRVVFFPLPALLLAFGFVGAWVLWKRREVWWFAVWTIVQVFPFTLVATVGVDWRLPATAAPLLYMLWGAGVVETVRWLWGLRKPPAA